MAAIKVNPGIKVAPDDSSDSSDTNDIIICVLGFLIVSFCLSPFHPFHEPVQT